MGKILEGDASNEGTSPKPHDSSLTESTSHLGRASKDLPGLQADAAQQEPDSFAARVAAALKASSQTIASLTSRLEAMLYYRSGVCIQGHAECCAAWAM